MSSIEWEIKSNRSYDQLIVKLDPQTKVIDYQHQLINSHVNKSIFPIAIINKQSMLMISAELGLNNTISIIDAASKGKSEMGLSRLVQLSRLIIDTQDFLFTSHQILIHPDLIRFEESMANESGLIPKIVILPISSGIDHDQLVIDNLINEWSDFYGFSPEMSNELINNYQLKGWAGIAEYASAVIADQGIVNRDTKPILPSRLAKYRKNAVNNEQRRYSKPILLWLVSALIFNVLTKTSLLSLSMVYRNSITIVIAISGIFLLIKSAFPHLTSKNLKSLKPLFAKYRLFRNNSSKNFTELISRNADSYGMAILAEGLPGTPQENEGRRAFILLDEFIIGRDSDNADLWLDDKTIGRQHARISRHEGSYFISDLGSKNGTRLDGRRLNRNEEYLLPDRCRLQFAEQVFFFQNEEPL